MVYCGPAGASIISKTEKETVSLAICLFFFKLYIAHALRVFVRQTIEYTSHPI